MKNRKIKIAVIGLGYVGFPVFFELNKKFQTIGYDLNQERILSLKNGIDQNKQYLKFNPKKLLLTDNIYDLKNFDVFIITVPTPIDKNYRPDLKPLKNACINVGKIMKKGSIVVFESTVYPGCTENFCVPILSKYSKLKYNKDYYCGYSPERINVGDQRYTLKKITKIISASNIFALKKIKKIYQSIVTPQLHVASSIKVAEAAKLIENIQRDMNIAFINELSVIFKKININTHEVLDAAATKWNFHRYFPGLVGGHCIGVDPYYLTYLAKKINYKPKVLLSGRFINENMSEYVTQRIKKHLNIYFKKKKVKILILGITFKENCNDVRNTKIVRIYKNLIKLNHKVDVYDPNVDDMEMKKIYKIKMLKQIETKYDYCLIAVRHKEFIKLTKKKIKSFLKRKSFVFDLKNSLNFELKNYERL